MDIVEFCEKVLNIQLLDFQKKFLRDIYMKLVKIINNLSLCLLVNIVENLHG